MKSYLDRAIVHIDGDAFFVSVEQAKDWRLKGKAVVTGGERFIAAAMSYEAKNRGVTRGMCLPDIRKICPDVIILPSDYVTYTIFARRMYNIVRRYTPYVEEYSIDECFADITGLDKKLGISYEEIGKKIKDDLEKKLGITFGVGLACTKVLAKIASKHRKPAGYTIIASNPEARHEFLTSMPIEKVWGIGSSTTRYLRGYGIMTAGEFAALSQGSLSALSIAKPYREIQQELNGISVLPVSSGDPEKPKSIMCTRTFVPASANPDIVFSHLSKNIEEACERLRHQEMCAKSCSIYVKSQDFRYYRYGYVFSEPTNDVLQVLSSIKSGFRSLLKTHLTYRASGVSFHSLIPSADVVRTPRSLFDPPPTAQVLIETSTQVSVLDPVSNTAIKPTKLLKLFDRVDLMNKKFGEHTIMIGSSLTAINFYKEKNSRQKNNDVKLRDIALGNLTSRTWDLPLIGEVRG